MAAEPLGLRQVGPDSTDFSFKSHAR